MSHMWQNFVMGGQVVKFPKKNGHMGMFYGLWMNPRTLLKWYQIIPVKYPDSGKFWTKYC